MQKAEAKKAERRGSKHPPAWPFFLLPSFLAFCLLPSAFAEQQTPIPGFTASAEVAGAYDHILNADFDGAAKALEATCPPAPSVACRGLEALNVWWQIQLDPRSEALDAEFTAKVTSAIKEAERMTRLEPRRAEGWFYLGAAYGARAQFRVHRVERLAAARDGKRIKESLERALELDPAMHDAEFGLGMYRYYADVAPGFFRFLRWLLLLPGGDRESGLAQMQRAGASGVLVGSEAQYQLHIVYLWYEQRWPDALTIVRALQARYPKNPLFRSVEAEILDVYFHDPAASLEASEKLLALASSGNVHRADLASTSARLNIAQQSIALKQTARAAEELDRVIAAQPTAPDGALARARAMRRALR